MKKILTFVFFASSVVAIAQDAKPVNLKSILLEQLRSTHNVKEWFVPVNTALDGVSPEQAKWKDGSGNHSIGQLASHLIFWNLDQLAKFKGEKAAPFNGNNDETFNNFDNANWKATVQKLDSVLVAWEKAIEAADDKKLQTWYSAIAHIGTHNAYHTGQMIFIRKLQGSWDAEKGVK